MKVQKQTENNFASNVTIKVLRAVQGSQAEDKLVQVKHGGPEDQ